MPTDGHLLKRLYSPAKKGAFNRAIMVRRQDAETCYGWVEDDFHHFGVRITHRDGMIVDVVAETRRAPWNTCQAAALPLEALKQKPLHPRASDIGKLINMRLQCTHMFDLAGLVMAHACRDEHERRYLAAVPSRPLSFEQPRLRQMGPVHVTLMLNGDLAMAWDLIDDDIVGPQEYAGHSLNDGFREWTEAMPLDEAEQAFVLRRAIMVSGGRLLNLDLVNNAAQAPLPPVCHTFRGPLESALRMMNSTRDFAGSSQALLADADDIPGT